MVSIGIDASESADQLRRYADAEGWEWRHALASRDYLNEASARFGSRTLTPPSDTTLVVDTRGNVDAHFGHKSEQQVRDLVAAARSK